MIKDFDFPRQKIEMWQHRRIIFCANACKVCGIKLKILWHVK